MKLGVLLKKLRESRGLSIKALSEISGVGNGTIGDIERGVSKSKISTLEKLSKSLDLNKEERRELFSSLIPADSTNNEIKKVTKLRRVPLYFDNEAEVTDYIFIELDSDDACRIICIYSERISKDILVLEETKKKDEVDIIFDEDKKIFQSSIFGECDAVGIVLFKIKKTIQFDEYFKTRLDIISILNKVENNKILAVKNLLDAIIKL